MKDGEDCEALIKNEHLLFEGKKAENNRVAKKHKFKFDNGAHSPIVYVDGEKISNEELKKIDPETIESVSVLKDAYAVAKYGKKAKNGVIKITLKK